MKSNVQLSSVEDTKEIAERIKLEFSDYIGNKSLKQAKPQLIRIGTFGGLPFESLSSDITLGCLPPQKICFGSCFAARSAFENGMDFGSRVTNIFDEQQLKEDLIQLDDGQKYIRNGWNSDPSWDWGIATRLASVIRHSGARLPIFITKMFKTPSNELIHELAQLNSEIRISISAFDPQSDIKRKIQFLETFRKVGGVGIPIVMSTIFTKRSLNQKQDSIVAYLVEKDFPVAENSLRFPQGSSMLPLVDLTKVATEQYGDYWCGRIYSQKIVQIPTTTSVPSNYSGLNSGYMSKIDPTFLQNLWVDPVPTNKDVLGPKTYRKPHKCGVATKW